MTFSNSFCQTLIYLLLCLVLGEVLRINGVNNRKLPFGTHVSKPMKGNKAFLMESCGGY